MKAILYNTGNNLPLLRVLRSLGFDALSFEERGKGVEMDIGLIRQAIGHEICLFANFDAYLLLRGERAPIEREVARQIHAAGSGGGVHHGVRQSNL
jgi:uroporphyrinogen-III decarboxylase